VTRNVLFNFCRFTARKIRGAGGPKATHLDVLLAPLILHLHEGLSRCAGRAVTTPASTAGTDKCMCSTCQMGAPLCARCGCCAAACVCGRSLCFAC
jgi:hypothetical protein